jgi:hypothetical protein
MALDARDGGRRLVDDAGAQPRDLGAQRARGEAAERPRAHAAHAQRRQHLADVCGQSGAVRDHRQPPRGKIARVRVREVGEAVQTDGGLAAARPTLDDDDARTARGDDVELARIDQRRDLGQVAVQRLAAGRRGTQHAARGAGSGVLAASERGLGQVGALPRAMSARARPDALRAGDAQEHAVFDRQRAPRDDIALDVALAETLLVVAALRVTIEELAHGCVAPIDDVDARGGVNERRPPDEHVALHGAATGNALAQAQMAEVRRRRIDEQRLQIGARHAHPLHALHLGDQRRNVFQARLADLVAQRHQFVGVGAPHRARPRRPPRPSSRRRALRHRREHTRQKPLLLGGNVAVAVHPTGHRHSR